MDIGISRHALIIWSKCIGGALSCLWSHSSEKLSFIFNFRCSLTSSSSALWVAHFGLPLVRLVTVLTEDYLGEFVDLLAMHGTSSNPKLRFQSGVTWSSLAWTILSILADDFLTLFPCHGTATSGRLLNGSTMFWIISLDLLNTPITRMPVSLVTVGCCYLSACLCSCFSRLWWAIVEWFLLGCHLLRGISTRLHTSILPCRRVKQKFIYVGWWWALGLELVWWLRSTISKLLCHQFRVFLHIISIISTISIAKSRVIGSVSTHIEFIAGCHTLRITIHLVIVMCGAIVRVVYCGTRYSICRTCAAFKINYWRPLLLFIYIIIITSGPKRNISSLLHGRFCHRAIVYVAVGVEWRLDFAMGRLVWVAVGMLLMMLR